MTIRQMLSLFGLLLAIGWTSGCANESAEVPSPGPAANPPESDGSSESTDSAANETTKPEPLAPEDVPLTEADWATVQANVAKHPGKVVVIDLWSTACGPCMKEFHNLVELSRKHPDKVVCMSFSLDYAGIKSKPPSYYEERVRKFLSEQGAGFDNYLCNQDPELVYDELDFDAIPAVMVFGTDGKLAEFFHNGQKNEAGEPKYGEEFTYADNILPLVDKLIAGTASNSGF